jgi:hypothetical protein
MATPAWAQAGFSQRSIFGTAPPRGQAMRSLVSAICALGAVSLFAGITFAFDVVPTTVAEWWPKSLNALPQLAVAWGASSAPLATGRPAGRVRSAPAPRCEL